MKDRNSSVGGIGFFGALTILFIGLKLERYHMVMAMDIGAYVDTYDYRHNGSHHLCAVL